MVAAVAGTATAAAGAASAGTAAAAAGAALGSGVVAVAAGVGACAGTVLVMGWLGCTSAAPGEVTTIGGAWVCCVSNSLIFCSKAARAAA